MSVDNLALSLSHLSLGKTPVKPKKESAWDLVYSMDPKEGAEENKAFNPTAAASASKAKKDKDVADVALMFSATSVVPASASKSSAASSAAASSVPYSSSSSAATAAISATGASAAAGASPDGGAQRKGRNGRAATRRDLSGTYTAEGHAGQVSATASGAILGSAPAPSSFSSSSFSLLGENAFASTSKLSDVSPVLQAATDAQSHPAITTPAKKPPKPVAVMDTDKKPILAKTPAKTPKVQIHIH